MALFTLEPHMPAGQWKIGLVMIEGCILPAIGLVAGGAVGSKPAPMFIITLVTGITIARRLFKISQHTRIEMAFHAGNIGMPSLQREGVLVTEPLSEPVDAVMTIEAGVAIGDRMRGGEGRVNLIMTGFASNEGKGCDIRGMTVCTGERFAASRKLVTSKGEAHRLVRERASLHDCQGGIRTAMLGMTIPAFQIGVPAHHASVQGGGIQQLLCHRGMTVHTTIRHPL